MHQDRDLSDARTVAAEIDARIHALPLRNAANVWALRRETSRLLRQAPPEFMLELARELVHRYGYRGLPYELLRVHKEAFGSLGAVEIEDLGKGIGSWGAVDSFARRLSGPAWHSGLIGDEVIHRWAHSTDRWWRRAALVSTVALNMRSHGGTGDVPRTLAICRLLVEDGDDMVVKALSWALRELVVHDPDAVRAFLGEHEQVLAARVKREVRNKLRTGLKNPKRSRR
jgi:3-methyladenine DNA glycosylase AlkD